MHFVFGSITTAFAKAQYAQDAPLGAQEKRARVKWKKGMWRLLGRGNNNEAQMESGKKGPCKVQTGMGQEYICFFLMLKKTLRQRARTRKERLFFVACDFFFCLSSLSLISSTAVQEDLQKRLTNTSLLYFPFFYLSLSTPLLSAH